MGKLEEDALAMRQKISRRLLLSSVALPILYSVAKFCYHMVTNSETTTRTPSVVDFIGFFFSLAIGMCLILWFPLSVGRFIEWIWGGCQTPNWFRNVSKKIKTLYSNIRRMKNDTNN